LAIEMNDLVTAKSDRVVRLLAPRAVLLKHFYTAKQGHHNIRRGVVNGDQTR